MNTIELFSGTKSFSKVAKSLGHKTWTIDNDKELEADFTADIMNMPDSLAVNEDILWASPPCTAFSVAAIGRHWNKDRTPKSDTARLGLDLLEKTIKIISTNQILKQDLIWYIENPRGMMRKVIDDIFYKHGIKNYRRVTISYCQYGDRRMKPTDIWTNDFKWIPRKMCKPNSSCHDKQPRGYRAKKEFNCLGGGTQGLKNAKERGEIPPQLFLDIFEHMNKDIQRKLCH